MDSIERWLRTPADHLGIRPYGEQDQENRPRICPFGLIVSMRVRHNQVRMEDITETDPPATE